MLLLALALATAPLEADQEALYQALKAQHALNAGRRLERLAYVGTLHVGAHRWRVVQTQELIRAAMVAHGYNQVVLLDEHLKVVRVLPFVDVPAGCVMGDRLYLDGDYGLDNTAPYGNVLQFHPDGSITITSVDANEWPLPPTGQRPRFGL